MRKWRTTNQLIPKATLIFLGVLSPLLGFADKSTEEKKRWPFFKPENISVPKVKDADKITNEIDSFIIQKLESKDLTLSPQASKQTLIRRLYFDLIGLPPTPEQIEFFINDQDPNAYSTLVDDLLKDPRYGERWARFWLDLARYADTAGYEGDPDMPYAWRYRDYVIDSLNRDKRYDLFIKEQLAGDEFTEIMGAGEIPIASAEKIVAMTFLRLAPFTEPRGDETRHELLSEMTSTTSSVFLGLTVGCAKCHDHKYDQIPTKDFYRMKAFFNTVQIMPPERGDGFQIGGSLPADFYRKGEKEWANKRRQEFESIQGELNKLTSEFKTRMTNNVNPDKGKVELDGWVNNRNNDKITEAERDRYNELKKKVPHTKQHLKRLRPMAMSLRHSFGPPYEPGVPTSRVMIRGEYDNPGEVVEAGFLSCITGDQEPAKIRLDPFKRWPTRSRRMALAKWIASAENPLTARVMMNRLWGRHFGRGIVATPSDFGKLSGGPSHQDLLDWLAIRFVKENWSLKKMHRLMVNSSTYKQDSKRIDPNALAKDPNNSLLSRFNRRRLEAEAIRDSVLFTSGRLNPDMFGLPIFPPLPGDIADRVKYDNSKWATDPGKEGRKRSIYIYQQRTLSMPFLQTFDALVCEDTIPRRQSSVTPLQALAMYNGNFANEESEYFAKRIVKEAGNDPTKRIKRAFYIALSRQPSEEEIKELLPYAANEEKLVGLSRILYNTTEFTYVD